uniref:Uncharacterized protein n=1 Tax=Takifugu rubripes TaxID=31033 RepID=A0A674PEL0_TAKRU
CSPKVSDQDLYRSIQGVLPRECDTPVCVLCAGMLRWTLHKKVQNNPENSLSLVRVLIKELEKAERRNARKCILPLLHTLMYTAYIPDELYKQVYDVCKRLLTHPQPYCSVGLSCSQQIKMERSTPGVTYQRMLTAEQSLKNEYYPFQERVFVLADPDVFSGPVGQVLCSDIETPSSREPLEPLDHMRCVVQHVLQAVLGAEHCHGRKLARALSVSGIVLFFISLLRPCGVLLFRVISLFLIDRANAVQVVSIQLHVRAVLPQSGAGRPGIGGNLSTISCRPTLLDFSYMSNDSGIERDLPPGAEPSPSLESTGPGNSWEQMDRRILLAWIYALFCEVLFMSLLHFSSFRVHLLKPSDPCSLGSYLSMVDPWYNSNIRSLGYMIPEMGPKTTLCLMVISYYIRMGQQPVYFTIYFVKVAFDALMGGNLGRFGPHFSGARLLFLTAVVEAKRIISFYFGPRQESKIRTRNIRIRSIESRAFCVTLDKDPRRTYRDVQR